MRNLMVILVRPPAPRPSILFSFLQMLAERCAPFPQASQISNVDTIPYGWITVHSVSERLRTMLDNADVKGAHLTLE